MIGGEGYTVPERVGPRGADNAANLVLAYLPCAQAVKLPGRRPLPKKAYECLECTGHMQSNERENTITTILLCTTRGQRAIRVIVGLVIVTYSLIWLIDFRKCVFEYYFSETE